MRRRHLWLLLAVALGVLAGYLWNRRSARVAPVAPPVTAQPAPVPAARAPEVPIQEGKTIDFSSGKPVVKATSEDQAAIDAAKKEMDEATKNITFGPTPPPPPPKKKD